MAFLRTVVITFALLASACSWADEAGSPPSSEDAKYGQLLRDGARLASSGKQLDAISIFEKVIAGYEEMYKGEEAKLYCARWQTEALLYLAEAVNAKTSAKVISLNWAYAYYLKAYSLEELGRLSEAKEVLGKAISLSPHNSQFLSEMGNVYQREKAWPKALETFKAAESDARAFSPPRQKDAELSRAWRGLGFVYVELGKLDEAEKMYRQCLELNSSDSTALNELRYVQSEKAKLNKQ